MENIRTISVLRCLHVIVEGGFRKVLKVQWLEANCDQSKMHCADLCSVHIARVCGAKQFVIVEEGL